MTEDRHPFRLDIDELLGPADGRADGELSLHDWDDDAQFRLHYQPVINNPSGRMVAVKALPRWEHPLFGTLSPRRFVPLVLNAGRMLDIGEAVLRRACIDLRAWQAAGHDGLRIDIELMQSQFHDPNLLGRINGVQRLYDLQPESICLQISETILRQNATANRIILEQLDSAGVGLALTNFGAGAFAVAALQSFPFNRINIGAAFVQDMVTIADDAAMASQIFTAVHGYGMRIGADGVETAAEYALLRQYRCDEIQGPYFYRALPAAEIGALLDLGAAIAEVAMLPQKPRALLLVDDDAAMLLALKGALRPDNYSIVTATSGERAVELLEMHRFDVIVCAQRLPGMCGIEFFHAAKRMHPDTECLLLSGAPDLQAVIDAVNSGAVDRFLVKPWDDARLRMHVATAFRHKELGDENRRMDLELHTAGQRVAQLQRELEALQRYVLAREGIPSL